MSVIGDLMAELVEPCQGCGATRKAFREALRVFHNHRGGMTVKLQVEVSRVEAGLVDCQVCHNRGVVLRDEGRRLLALMATFLPDVEPAEPEIPF